jgi:hypothetical protein
MRRLVLSVCLALLVACGSEDAAKTVKAPAKASASGSAAASGSASATAAGSGSAKADAKKKSKKAKKKKKPKRLTPAARVERLCKARCARANRCDDREVEGCLQACWRDRDGQMHAYAPKFVEAYADCAEKLACDKKVSQCVEVAVATMTVKEKAARELFEQCHDRRVACDGNWKARCDGAVGLTEHGRERVRDCMALPCDRIRTCLHEAFHP